MGRNLGGVMGGVVSGFEEEEGVDKGSVGGVVELNIEEGMEGL